MASTPAARRDRSVVVRRVSDRYRDILTAWRYPDLQSAHVGEDLTPYVDGRPYRTEPASGRALIALAWQLAVFEIAWESGTSHPGFLLLEQLDSAGRTLTVT